MIKRKIGNHTIVTAAGIGLAVSLIVSLLLVCIVSTLVLKGAVIPEVAVVAVTCVQGLAAFIGALLAGALSQKKKINSIVGAVGTFYVTLICGGMLFFNGLSTNAISGLIVIAAGGLLAIFLVTREKRTKHKRGSHRKNR